jgi:transposase
MGGAMLKLFLASLKPQEASEPAIRVETEPGEQIRVDWAAIRRGDYRLSVFVATSGWSRATYVEFVTDERVQPLIERERLSGIRRQAARSAQWQHAYGSAGAARP